MHSRGPTRRVLAGGTTSGSAILQPDISFAKKRHEVIDAEIGQYRALPIERGRLRLAGFLPHLAERRRIVRYFAQPIANAVGVEKFDRLPTPRTALLRVKNRKIIRDHAAMVTIGRRWFHRILIVDRRNQYCGGNVRELHPPVGAAIGSPLL